MKHNVFDIPGIVEIMIGTLIIMFVAVYDIALTGIRLFFEYGVYWKGIALILFGLAVIIYGVIRLAKWAR